MLKKNIVLPLLLLCSLSGIMAGCGNDAPPMGAAVQNRDSLPMMVTHGVSKLISDSGVVKYKVVAEEWQYFDKTTPTRQVFPKGVFLERYDKTFKVDMYLTADTAYCYDENLWELRGRVFVCDREKGITYRSEELFWDTQKHRMYSRKYMHIVTPDKDLEGDWFEANDQLTYYHVRQTAGFIPMPGSEAGSNEEVIVDEEIVTDSLPVRDPAQPRPRRQTGN